MPLSLHSINFSNSSHILVCFISRLWLSCEFIFSLKIPIIFLFPYWEETCVFFIHLCYEMHSILILEHKLFGAQWLSSYEDRLLPSLPHLGILLHWAFDWLLCSCIPCCHLSWLLPLFCWDWSIHFNKSFLFSNLDHVLDSPFWKKLSDIYPSEFLLLIFQLPS